MREVTLHELKSLAKAAYWDLWNGARSLGRDVKLYIHWTAARYNQTFDEYHVNITGDGRVFVSTNDLAEVKNATYRRNTGSIAITLCCAYDATGPDNLGPYPPTEAQINAVSQVICVLADALDLTIDADRVMTHAEAADNIDGLYTHDDYGPDSTCERWDLWVLREGEEPGTGGQQIRGNANYYRHHQLLANV
nr:MAG TPA: peptidoglycan recognition protein [Caudoviricetes sp.]